MENTLLETSCLQIKSCRACTGYNLEKIWKLANSPYGDLYKKTFEDAIGVNYETLTLGFCHDCKMLQLMEITDIKKVYEDYLYHSGITNGLSSYYANVVNRLISDYSLPLSGLIIDIGSNDGTFLSGFLKRGYSVLGIEPSIGNAIQAKSRGVDTMNEFFSDSTVWKIKNESEYPSLISINYTLANISNLNSFFKDITSLMNEQSILSIITGYHPDQYAVNMFEYINHDHLVYLTVESLKNLCSLFGLKIIEVNKVEHKGGSIHFIIAKENSDFETQSSVAQLLQREHWLNANLPSFTRGLELNVARITTSLKEIIRSKRLKNLCGIGASISTTYLCNQLQLNDVISKLYDDDAKRIGLYSPGCGKLVGDLSKIPNSKECDAIILAWQHSEKLLARLSNVGFEGRIVIPLPVPQIIRL